MSESLASVSASGLGEPQGWRGRIGRIAETHPVAAPVAAALVVRVVVAAALQLTVGLSLNPDEAQYSQIAFEAASGESAQWDANRDAFYHRNGTLLWPVTAVYWLFGYTPLVAKFLVASVSALAAGVTSRLALELVRARWAAVAGLIVALLPSQVLFSSLIMKDGLVWLLVALIVLLATLLTRQPPARQLVTVGAIALLMLALGRLRFHTLIIVAWAVVVGALFRKGRDKFIAVVALPVLAVSVPWVTGLGPGGVDFVTGRARSVDSYRTAQATGNTPLVPGPPTTGITTPSGTGAGTGMGTGTGGGDDPGPHTENPRPGREPDSRTEDEVTVERSPLQTEASDSFRYLPRGLVVMLLEPFPWRPAHNLEFAAAKAEMVFWYPALLLALLGVFMTIRDKTFWRPLPVAACLFGGGAVLVAALTEGNFGTAFRHRGEFVWVLALFAVAGASHLATRGLSQRESPRSQTPVEPEASAADG